MCALEEFGVFPCKEVLENVEGDKDEVFHTLSNFIFTQMTVDAGIQQYGDAAVQALVKEFAQLDGMEAFTGINPKDISEAQKREHYRSSTS